jgi:hypothetical protein
MSEKPEPVAWMRKEWSPDCGSYFDFCAEEEMGWRDRKEWTPLYTTSPDIEALRRQNERLREALTYDWDQLDACRESLREHMVEIKRLRELLTEAKDLAWSFGADSLRDRINEVLQEETR